MACRMAFLTHIRFIGAEQGAGADHESGDRCRLGHVVAAREQAASADERGEQGGAEDLQPDDSAGAGPVAGEHYGATAASTGAAELSRVA